MHSRDKFLEHLRESRLLSADEVGDALAGINDAQEYSDAKGIAGVFVTRGLLTAFQVKSLFRGQGRNLALGNYIILDELGQGGMGMVYRARHRNMKREVALKVVSEQISSNEKTMRRFHREVEASAKLNHPNIVTAYDAAEDRGIWYLVMELVDGNDLASIVKQNGPLTVARTVELILQVAAGSQYAHEQGVIHRDIKPSNLLLDRSGTVKILDMGLARIQAEQEGLAGANKAELTHTGVVMGTVDYMAPEQAVNTKDADARSDIYSLGCTLWYLLTGRPVYQGDSMMSILLAHRDQPIPSLQEIRDDVSPALQAVFERMAAKSPEARYQAMSEVISDLQPFRTGEADLAAMLPAVRSEDSKIDSFLANLSDDSMSPTNVVSAGTQIAPQPSSSDPTQVADWHNEKTETQPTHPSDDQPTKPEYHPSGGSKRRRSLAIAGGLAGLLLLLLILLPDSTDPSNSPEDHGDENPHVVTFDELDLVPLFEDSNPDGTVQLSAPFGTGQFSHNTVEFPDRYRLELKLLREKATNSQRPTAGTTHFQFKVGEHYIEYYLNYRGDESIVEPANGFVNFNQRSIDERRNEPDSEIRRGRWLRDDVADTVVFEVQSVPERNFARIVLSINGEEKSRWQGSLANFQLQSERFQKKRPWDLVVGQWNGELTIQSARVTRLEPPESGPPELQPAPKLIDITDQFTFYNPKSKEIAVRWKIGSGGGPQTNFPVGKNYRVECALEREGKPNATHFQLRTADHFPDILVDHRHRPDTFYSGVKMQKHLSDETRTDVARHRLLRNGVFEHLAFDIHSTTPSGDAEIVLRVNGVEEFRWQGDPQQFWENDYASIHVVHWNSPATFKNIFYMPLPD